MAVLGRGRRQLASLLWKASVQEEVDAELAFHVEMRTRELVEQGMSPAAARAAAIARFGDITNVNRECRSIGHLRERDMRRTEYLDELLHDVRFAIRQLLKTPAFAAIAILTLGLGIGATTAIFSAVEAVVLRPFPYPNANRLVFAFTHSERFGDGGTSVGDYDDWRKRSRSFTQLAAVMFQGVTIANGDSPDRVTAARVTANLFPLYGVKPARGRVFSANEDQPGGNVVVLSDGYWRQYMGAADVIGKPLVINGQPYSIVGIMPASFDPTDSHEALWIPAAFTPEQLAMHDEHFLTVVGRLKPGTTIAGAQQEMDAVAARMRAEYPTTNQVSGVRLQAFGEAIVGDYRTRLLVILGAVACVLLIACGNVANLLLARGAARGKELAIRSAIGAGRSRILRQLLTESVVLAAAAAVAGVVLAWIAVHFLVGMAPATIPRLAAASINLRVVAFTAGIAAVSAIVFGLVPAIRAVRGDVQATLREGGRNAMASARDHVRAVLVASEVAIALTLLIGAGLLIRSAIYLNRVDPGFDPDRMISARVALRPSGNLSQDATIAEQLFQRLAVDLANAPGVAAAAVTSGAPFGAGSGTNGLIPEGKAPTLDNAINSRLRIVTPGYLSAMKIPLVAGRDIGEQDIRGGLRVMVVSQALARAAWPNENPIGKRIACCEGSPSDPRFKTVVGVAADVHTGGPTQDIQPEFYLPITQVPEEAWRWTNRTMTVVVRSKAEDPTALTPTIRSVMKSIDPTAPVFSVSTMARYLSRSMAESRFHLALLLSLGVVGLLLAAAGIYSVISYFVALRTHEIGVRMALGATPRDVVRLLTFGGLRPVIAGALIGGVAAAWATRLLRGSLYGVAPSDPRTFASVIAVLLFVALLAILIPARRATSVDPTTALHG